MRYYDICVLLLNKSILKGVFNDVKKTDAIKNDSLYKEQNLIDEVSTNLETTGEKQFKLKK